MFVSHVGDFISSSEAGGESETSRGSGSLMSQRWYLGGYGRGWSTMVSTSSRIADRRWEVCKNGGDDDAAVLDEPLPLKLRQISNISSFSGIDLLMRMRGTVKTCVLFHLHLPLSTGAVVTFSPYWETDLVDFIHSTHSGTYLCNRMTKCLSCENYGDKRTPLVV